MISTLDYREAIIAYLRRVPSNQVAGVQRFSENVHCREITTEAVMGGRNILADEEYRTIELIQQTIQAFTLQEVIFTA